MMAEKHGKPWIHVDANRVSVEAATEIIRAWLNGNDLEILNVAGPRASKDRKIYTTTKTILRTVLLSSYEDR